MAKSATTSTKTTGRPRGLEDLTPDPENAVTHSARNLAAIDASLEAVGAGRSIVIDERGVVLAGNATRERAAARGMKLRIVDTDADTIVAVRRSGLTKKTKALLALYDNGASALTEWNPDALRAIARTTSRDDLKRLFTAPELMKLIGSASAAVDVDVIPEARRTSIRAGDLFQLGRHRLLCGDSAVAADVAILLGDDDVDFVLTDPPYCSGGFQEAGKAAGSVGTRSDEMVHNDTLSTRGYVALMKRVIPNYKAKAVYVFTDWRMWVNLFDVVESSGYGVRNMIVWDKGSAGMGQGWRMQHELIMAALTSRAPRFDPRVSQGNVIQSARTGNPLHPTQKPVDLLEKIIRVSNWAKVIADPFAGSGSTVIAAEQTGIACRAMELTPRFCQVTIDRWEGVTNEKAVKISSAAAPARRRAG